MYNIYLCPMKLFCITLRTKLAGGCGDGFGPVASQGFSQNCNQAPDLNPIGHFLIGVGTKGKKVDEEFRMMFIKCSCKFNFNN